MVDIEQLEAVKVNANASFKNGNYELACSQYAEVIQLIDLEFRATEILPDPLKVLKIACLNNSAASFLELHDFSQALSTASAALHLDNSNAKAKYRRAVAYKGLGNLKEADSEIKEVLRVEPNNRQAKTLLEELLHEAVGQSISVPPSDATTDIERASPSLPVGEEAITAIQRPAAIVNEFAPPKPLVIDAATLADITNFVRPDWKPEDATNSTTIASDSSGQPTAAKTQDSISRILQLQSSLAKAKGGIGKSTNGIEALMKRVKISTTPKNASSNVSDKSFPTTAAVDEAISELNELEESAKQRVAQTIAAKEQRARKLADKNSSNSSSSSSSDTASKLKERAAAVTAESLLRTKNNIISNSAVSAWEDLIQDEAGRVNKFRTVIADKDELAKVAAKRKRKVEKKL